MSKYFLSICFRKSNDVDEYMTMTNGGQTMSYQEWFLLKGQALSQTQNNSSNDYSSSSDANSNYASNSNITSSSGKMCNLCYGTGDCRTCEGKGFYYSPYDLSKKIICTSCANHDGKCKFCNGTGKR